MLSFISDPKHDQNEKQFEMEKRNEKTQFEYKNYTTNSQKTGEMITKQRNTVVSSIVFIISMPLF